ncbi:hypothetical protein O7627_31725 [Solwaraspora sp. WMMD1047]|uniref:hypothetical protein n=1 Tax=Solwaraspora sp. WMMD1047 TaxID=3016102 RepID=UPI0024177D79|nr:hypothetical protein [Solwaraspora sp. WMMD1047]MDG4833846.1 hypothetical protein [Solwaraspora sp. WMMD1047]
MMETAMYQFLLDVPRATAIWLGLMVIALIAMVGLVARTDPAEEPAPDPVKVPDGDPAGDPALDVGVESGSRAATEPAPGSDASPTRPVRRRAAAGVGRRDRPADRRRARLVRAERELRRYAEEVTVAAERAAVTAQRRRDEWAQAQDRVEAAWRALDAATAEVDRLAAAAALPAPHTPRTPAEYADRERYLHRAAMSACVRKELSVLDLSDALAHRKGWDPRLHPVEQELVLRRAARDELLAAERAAAERERAAWDDAGVALVAARALRQEAAEAADRARQARRRLGLPEPGQVPESEPAAPARPILAGLRGWRAARVG